MNDILLVILILTVVATLVGVATAAFAGWRLWRSDENRLARRIAKLRFADKLALGRGLFGDPRIPFVARLMAVVLVLYIASPIDFLPDFIPGVGFLDDILIAVVGVGILLRSVPRYVIEEHVERYEAGQQPTSLTAAGH